MGNQLLSTALASEEQWAACKELVLSDSPGRGWKKILNFTCPMDTWSVLCLQKPGCILTISLKHVKSTFFIQMYFLRINLSKGQVRLMTCLSTDQNHLSGASGHRFCLTGQLDFVIGPVDSVPNFPKEIIINIFIFVRSLIYLLFFKYWLVLFQWQLLKNIFRVICCEEGEKTKSLISSKAAVTK